MRKSTSALALGVAASLAFTQLAPATAAPAPAAVQIQAQPAPPPPTPAQIFGALIGVLGLVSVLAKFAGSSEGGNSEGSANLFNSLGKSTDSGTRTRYTFDTRKAALEIWKESNRVRKEHGLQEVKWYEPAYNDQLDWLKYIGDRGIFRHPEGAEWNGRFLAENLHFAGYSSGEFPSEEEFARRTVDSWMHSPGHRHNLLTPAHTIMTAGIYIPSNDGRIYAGQRFGNESDRWKYEDAPASAALTEANRERAIQGLLDEANSMRLSRGLEPLALDAAGTAKAQQWLEQQSYPMSSPFMPGANAFQTGGRLSAWFWQDDFKQYAKTFEAQFTDPNTRYLSVAIADIGEENHFQCNVQLHG